MKKALFSGVCTALVTPFIDGKINYPMLKILLKRQIDAGIKAVVLCGTTGEAPTLSDREKLEIFRIGKELAQDDCLIIAGTGSNSTAHTIELSRAAEEIGVDGVLAVSPYYNKTNPDGIYAHYRSIAHSIHIPVILYNVPSRTGLDIPVSVYKELAKLPNIAGVKEASTDITKISHIKNSCPADFSIWTGNDDMTVPTMALGGQGVISVASNVCPSEMLSMTTAALNEDFESAGQIQCALQPVIDLLFCDVNPIPVKAALNCIGYDCGGYRLPLTDLNAEKHNRIRNFFLS